MVTCNEWIKGICERTQARRHMHATASKKEGRGKWKCVAYGTAPRLPHCVCTSVVLLAWYVDVRTWRVRCVTWWGMMWFGTADATAVVSCGAADVRTSCIQCVGTIQNSSCGRLHEMQIAGDANWQHECAFSRYAILGTWHTRSGSFGLCNYGQQGVIIADAVSDCGVIASVTITCVGIVCVVFPCVVYLWPVRGYFPLCNYRVCSDRLCNYLLCDHRFLWKSFVSLLIALVFIFGPMPMDACMVIACVT